MSGSFLIKHKKKTRNKRYHCKLNVASLWLGRRSLRAFATGTYRRPLLTSNIVLSIKTNNHKYFNQFPKTLFFGYLNFSWPSFGEKYCRQRYFADTTTVLRTTYINVWSEWNVSVLPMTLFKICLLIFHERKGESEVVS